MPYSHTPLPLWQVLYEWMKLQGVSVDKKFCRDEITAHADYPALTSIMDFLNMGGRIPLMQWRPKLPILKK